MNPFIFRTQGTKEHKTKSKTISSKTLNVGEQFTGEVKALAKLLMQAARRAEKGNVLLNNGSEGQVLILIPHENTKLLL